MALLVALGLVLGLAQPLQGHSVHVHTDAIAAEMQRVVDAKAAQYDMGLSAAYFDGKQMITVAAGHSDSGAGTHDPGHRRSRSDDLYVWGSTTKMYTAPAVLQLVERGLVGLDDAIALHVDPFLRKINGTTLSDRFGHTLDGVKIRHLLHMTSGIQDYDGDDYESAQFAHPSHDFGPVEILSRFVPVGLDFAPGTQQEYCSTNYILLGFVIATHSTTPLDSWRNLDQLSVIPHQQRSNFNATIFANRGACSMYTPVHGFMQGRGEAGRDVWNVSCTGGWTGGNLIASVADVARYTFALYDGEDIVSSASLAEMKDFDTPGRYKFYGMGTFLLDWSVSDADNFTGAVGHVGDTYGYQSQTTYVNGIVLTVGTNIERKDQAQPADVTCQLFNSIKALKSGRAPPNCTFTVPYQFIGTCKCKEQEQTVAEENGW